MTRGDLSELCVRVSVIVAENEVYARSMPPFVSPKSNFLTQSGGGVLD
jgi:hypothetical protein